MILAALVLLSSGCVSKMVLDESKKQVAIKKAVIKNDQPAIKAIRLGEDSVGVGIDVSNWEALTERPWYQLGAALADAAIIYAANEGIKGLNDDDGKNTGDGSTSINVNSGRDTSVTVYSDGNDTTTTTDNSDNSDRSTPTN